MGVRDDIRGALRPELPPEYHEWRLGRTLRSLWRIAFVVVGILALAGLCDLLGLIG